MKKLIYLFAFFCIFPACEQTSPSFQLDPVKDLVTTDIPFKVIHIDCDELDNTVCDTMPVDQATIWIWQILDGNNRGKLLSEKKTDTLGELEFKFIPLGDCHAEIYTSEYGDTSVLAVSFIGRNSSVIVKF